MSQREGRGEIDLFTASKYAEWTDNETEWWIKTGIYRAQLRLWTMRGKGGCDGAGCVVAHEARLFLASFLPALPSGASP